MQLIFLCDITTKTTNAAVIVISEDLNLNALLIDDYKSFSEMEKDERGRVFCLSIFLIDNFFLLYHVKLKISLFL